MVKGKKNRYILGFAFLALFALVFFSDTLLSFLFGAGTSLWSLLGWGMKESFSYGLYLFVFMLICATLGVSFIVAALLYVGTPGVSQSRNLLYRDIRPLLLVLIGVVLFLVVHFDIGFNFFGVKTYLKIFSAFFVLLGIWGFFKKLRAETKLTRP